jgi:hypothetical protein
MHEAIEGIEALTCIALAGQNPSNDGATILAENFCTAVG